MKKVRQVLSYIVMVVAIIVLIIFYNKYNFNIMFSGHAHGGQFILPFIGGLFAPGQGILPKYYRGIHGEKNKLIISRGLGNSGFPLRLFNRPEVIVVDIYNEKII